MKGCRKKLGKLKSNQEGLKASKRRQKHYNEKQILFKNSLPRLKHRPSNIKISCWQKLSAYRLQKFADKFISEHLSQSFIHLPLPLVFFGTMIHPSSSSAYSAFLALSMLVCSFLDSSLLDSCFLGSCFLGYYFLGSSFFESFLSCWLFFLPRRPPFLSSLQGSSSFCSCFLTYYFLGYSFFCYYFLGYYLFGCSFISGLLSSFFDSTFGSSFFSAGLVSMVSPSFLGGSYFFYSSSLFYSSCLLPFEGTNIFLNPLDTYPTAAQFSTRSPCCLPILMKNPLFIIFLSPLLRIKLMASILVSKTTSNDP